MRKIRMISRIAAAAITACMLFSNQPWTYAAAEVKQDSELAVQYVSEIKMFYGSSEDEAKKDCVNEGYIFSSTNMNAGANTEIGAYLGYKTTEDPDEAITDITLLDMKNSHYEEMSYQEFLDKHVTEFDTQAGEIMKLVNDFRDKYDAGSPNAIAAYDSLNLIYISDTESPDAASNLLGNYMLNKADRTFFAKFIQRGNSMVLNKIISILANATADYNADHTTWVERAKVSELPTMMQKAKSATLNEYNARFGDPAKTLIQDIQEFAAVYAEAKERYDLYGESLGYGESVGLNEGSTAADLMNAGTDCRFPEYAEALHTYAMLDAYVYQSAGETVVTNAALLTGSENSEADAQVVYTDNKTLADYFMELAYDPSLSDHPERVYPLIQGMTQAQIAVLSMCGLNKLISGLYPAENYLQSREEAINQAKQNLIDSGLPSGRIYLWSGTDTTMYGKKVAETSTLIEAKYSGRDLKESIDAEARNESNTLAEVLKYVETATLIYSGLYMFASIFISSSLLTLGTSICSMAGLAMSVGLVGTAIAWGALGAAFCALWALNILAVVISLALLVYNILEWTGALDSREEVDYDDIPEIVFHVRDDSQGKAKRIRYDCVHSNASTDILGDNRGFFEKLLSKISDEERFKNNTFADVNAFQSLYDRWITMYTTKAPDAGEPITVIDGQDPFITRTTYQAPEGYRPLTLFSSLQAANINDVEIDDEKGSDLFVFFPGSSGVMNSGTIVESGQYVTDVRLSSASNKSDAINALKNASYEYIDMNLTPGHGETYLGYKLGSENTALTDIRVSTVGTPKIEFGDVSYSKAGMDNFGRTQDGICLYKTTSAAAGTPIIKISVEHKRLPLGSGAEPVCLFSGGNAVDIGKYWRNNMLDIENDDPSYFLSKGGYDSTFNGDMYAYQYVHEEDPYNGMYLYFWPKEQFMSEDENGTPNPSYVGGFSYFIAGDSTTADNTFGTNYEYMQTFAKENGFELIQEDGTAFRTMTPSAGEMTLMTRWRDVGGYPVDTYNFDQAHTLVGNIVVANSDGGLISATMTGNAGRMDSNTSREREPRMIYHTAQYFGVSYTYNPYRAITGISALMTSYTETTHQIKYTGISTPAGTLQPCNISMQGHPITGAGISSSYFDMSSMVFPFYTNYTARQRSDLDWMTDKETEIHPRYLLTAGPREGILPIAREDLIFVTQQDPGTIDGFVPLCDMRTPGDTAHPFNLALETTNCGSKYLYLYLSNNAGGRAGAPKNDGHNVYRKKKYIAAVFCGVGKTPEEAIAKLYSQANEQWPALSAAFSDIAAQPLVTEFDEILPIDLSSDHPWYELHCNDTSVNSLKNGEWVRGNDAAYYRWEGHEEWNFNIMGCTQKEINEYEQMCNCAYVGVVRTDFANGKSRNAVYGLVKYYDKSDVPSSTLMVGSTNCNLAGGPVDSPEGRYSLYYTGNTGAGAFSAPITDLVIDDEMFINGYNTSFAVSSSDRVGGSLPEYTQLRMRTDEHLYFHLAYDRVYMPYIEDIYIGVGKTRKEAYADLIGMTNAYAAIDVNCNNNSYSDQWIAIGYRRTNIREDAIKDVFLYYGNDPEDTVMIGDGYAAAESYVTARNPRTHQPLKDADGNPIKKKTVSYQEYSPDEGATYYLLKHNLKKGGAETFALNQGNGGKGIYLYYTSDNICYEDNMEAEIFPITSIALGYGDISPKFANAEDLAKVYQGAYYTTEKVSVKQFEDPRWECVIGVEDEVRLWKMDASNGRRMSLNEGILPGMGNSGWHAGDNRVYMYINRDKCMATGGEEPSDYAIRPNAALPEYGYYSADSRFGILKQTG